MTAATEALKLAFRDYLTNNVPATGPNKPYKAEVRAALELLSAEIYAAQGNIDSYATVAALPSGAANGTQARVYDDGTATNNTYWLRRDGSWQIDEDLIASFATILQPLIDEALAYRDEAEGFKDEAEAAADAATAAAQINAYSTEEMPQVAERGTAHIWNPGAGADGQFVVPYDKAWRYASNSGSLKTRVPELLDRGDPTTNRSDYWRDADAVIQLDFWRDRYVVGEDVFYSFAAAVTAGVATGTRFGISHWVIPDLLPYEVGYHMSVWATAPNPAAGPSTTQRIVSIHDGADGSNSDEGVFVSMLRNASSFPQSQVSVRRLSGTSATLTTDTGNLDAGGAYPGSPFNVAASLYTDNFRFRANAQDQTITDTGGNMPAGINTITIGAYPDETQPFGGTVGRVTIYPGPAADDDVLRTLSMATEVSPQFLFTDTHPGVGNGGFSRNGWTYFDWCDADGLQGISRINEDTGLVEDKFVLASRFRIVDPSQSTGGDDHLIPASLFDQAGRLISTNTGHNDFPQVYYRISPTGKFEDFGPERTYSDGSGSNKATYCSLIMHEATGDIYALNRFSNYMWGLSRLENGADEFTFLCHMIQDDQQCYLNCDMAGENVMRFFSSLNSELNDGVISMFEVDLETGTVSTIDDADAGNIFTATDMPLAVGAMTPFITPPSGYNAATQGPQDGNADRFVYKLASNDSVAQEYWVAEFTGSNSLDPADWTFTKVCDAGVVTDGTVTAPFYGDGRRSGGIKLSAEPGRPLRCFVGRTYREVAGDTATIEQWDPDDEGEWQLTRTIASSALTGAQNGIVMSASPVADGVAIPVIWSGGFYADFPNWNLTRRWEYL